MLTFKLLGLRIDALTKGELFQIVSSSISENRQCVIGNHNVHSLYLWPVSPGMRKFYESADYIQIDGMPLVWLGRLLGLPLKAGHRTTNFDLLPLLAEEAVRRKWRIFYLGSRPGVAETAAQTLRTNYPGLNIVTCHGHFVMEPSGAGNQTVLSQIRDFDPDILMVGMGMPRQEIWVGDNHKHTRARVILCCGGLMDLIAGEIPTAPRWLGPMGLEWLYRLFSEPRRLWRRYLIEPWIILTRLIKEYRRSGKLRIQNEIPPEGQWNDL